MLHYLSLLGGLFVFSFVIGWFVTYKNLRVNYARKILSIGFFLYSAYVLQSSGWQSLWGNIAGALTPLLWLVVLIVPLRKRLWPLQICFSSFDRPEDRPYTMLWLSTGIFAGYWVLVAMIAWLRIYNAAHLIYITIFISTFGDGLAEPVGVRFGRHAYKVRALFTDRLYHRTWEGSAVVALSAVLAILLMHNSMDMKTTMVLLALMPCAMTLTEARSPHTWDQPFLHLVGGLITVFAVAL